MINHIRTLLLNKSPEVNLLDNFGDEVIDPKFVPNLDSMELKRSRSLLLNPNSHKLVHNYITSQLVKLIHDDPVFESYLSDTRRTDTDSNYWNDFPFGNVLDGVTTNTSISGDLDEELESSYFYYVVNVYDNAADAGYEVIQTQPGSHTQYFINVDDNVTPKQLVGDLKVNADTKTNVKLFASLGTDISGGTFSLETDKTTFFTAFNSGHLTRTATVVLTKRPKHTLVDLLPLVTNGNMNWSWPNAAVEPYKTLHSLVKQKYELPNRRLAAATLLIALRTELEMSNGI